MTIAIGINLEEFILLAADTRTTEYDFLGNTIRFYDESEKIKKTKIGLMTGAGNLALLEAVKERFAEKEALDTNEILKIIEEVRLYYINLFDFYNLVQYNKILHSTGWIFTYLTMINNNPILRLAIYHPSLGSGIGLYSERQPAAIFPHEASKQEAEELSKVLEEIVKPYNEFKDFSACIEYYLKCIGTFINSIHPRYPSVSSSCQFGIHKLEGVYISPIIKPQEATKLNISFTYEEKD